MLELTRHAGEAVRIGYTLILTIIGMAAGRLVLRIESPHSYTVDLLTYAKPLELQVDGYPVKISLVSLQRGQARLSFEAPRALEIQRLERGCPAREPKMRTFDQHWLKERLIAEAPALLTLIVAKPEITLEIKRHEIRVDMSKALGTIAKLITEGFLDTPKTGSALHKELGLRWAYKGNVARVYEQLDALHKLGFIVRDEKGGYQAIPDMKIRIVDA